MKNIFLKIACMLVCMTALILAVASCSKDKDGEHTHSFSAEWTADATGHWHAATCAHGGEKSDFSAHVGTADDCKCDVCGYVTHTFGSEWIYNDSKHWHAASCGKDNHRTDVSAHVGTEDDCTCDVCNAKVHSFGEWTTVKAATCSEKGQKKRVCSKCGAHELADIEKLNHTPGEPIREDVKPATCTENGSYTEVIICSVCKDEISRTQKVITAEGHGYSTEWKKDATQHYKICKCGAKSEAADHVYSGTSTVCTVCGYKDHEHTPAQPVKENEVGPTCTSAGHYDSVVYCSECGAEISRASLEGEPATNHTPGAEKKENTVQPTCTEDGSYDSVIYCTECGAEISREEKTIPTTGHSYSDEWQFDENGHWKVPTCGHNDADNQYSAHVGMDDCVCDECGYVSHKFGDKWYHNEKGHWHIGDCGNANHKSDVESHVGMDDCVCDECGYVSHTYSDEWSYDESYHWHAASCEHKNEKADQGAHDFDEHGKCKDCGYVDPDSGSIELPIIPA